MNSEFIVLVVVAIAPPGNSKGGKATNSKVCLYAAFRYSHFIGHCFCLAISEMLNRQAIQICGFRQEASAQLELNLDGTCFRFHFLAVDFKAHIQSQEVIISPLAVFQGGLGVLIRLILVRQLLHHQLCPFRQNASGGSGLYGNGLVPSANGGSLDIFACFGSCFLLLFRRFVSILLCFGLLLVRFFFLDGLFFRLGGFFLRLHLTGRCARFGLVLLLYFFRPGCVRLLLRRHGEAKTAHHRHDKCQCQQECQRFPYFISHKHSPFHPFLSVSQTTCGKRRWVWRFCTLSIYQTSCTKASNF